MLVRLPVAILSFPLLLQVAATEAGQWELGEKSANCVTTCSGQGLICDKDANAAMIIHDLSTKTSFEDLLYHREFLMIATTCTQYSDGDAGEYPALQSEGICLTRTDADDFTCTPKDTNSRRLCWCTPTGAKPKTAKYLAKRAANRAAKYWRRLLAKRVRNTGAGRFMGNAFFKVGCSTSCKTEDGETSFVMVVDAVDGQCPGKVYNKRAAKIIKRRALKPKQHCRAQRPLLCSYCMAVNGKAPILKEVKSHLITKPEKCKGPKDLMEAAGECQPKAKRM